MLRRISILIFFTSLFYTNTFAQELEPLDLAKRIFDKEPTIDLTQYSTKEYREHPNGRDLLPSININFRLLEQAGNTAVVNMTLTDSIGQGFDSYLFFKKEDTWKISAFRALAMTGFYEQAILEIEKARSNKTDTVNNKTFLESIEDIDFFLANAKLVIDLDDNIIKHFEVNKQTFDSLRVLALNELSEKEVSSEQTIKLLENKKEDYKKLLIDYVSLGDYMIGKQCICFTIGGMLDNTVGYLYIENKNNLPKMSPNSLIMLREIGDGWYMFKTT